MTLFSVPKFTGFGLNLALTGYFLVGNTNATQDDMKEQTPAADAKATFDTLQRVGDTEYICIDQKNGGAKGDGGLVIHSTLLDRAVEFDHECRHPGKTCRDCYGTGKDLRLLLKYMMKKDKENPHSDLGEVLVAKGLKVFEALHKAENEIDNTVPYGADMITQKVGADVYILSKWIDNGLVSEGRHFKEFYDFCYDNDGTDEGYVPPSTAIRLMAAAADKRNKPALHYLDQERMTQVMKHRRERRQPLQNMMAGKWARLFFGDYSVHPLNEIVVTVPQGHLLQEYIVQFDYGAGHDNTGGLFSNEILPNATRLRGGKGENKNFFKIIDPFEILSIESIGILECLSGAGRTAEAGTDDAFISQMAAEFDALTVDGDFNDPTLLKKFLVRFDVEKQNLKDEQIQAMMEAMQIKDIKTKYIHRLRRRQESAKRLMVEIIKFQKIHLKNTAADEYDRYLSPEERAMKELDFTNCVLGPFMEKYISMYGEEAPAVEAFPGQSFKCEKKKLSAHRWKGYDLREFRFTRDEAGVYINWNLNTKKTTKTFLIRELNINTLREMTVGTMNDYYHFKSIPMEDWTKFATYFEKTPICAHRRLATMHKLLQDIKNE